MHGTMYTKGVRSTLSPYELKVDLHLGNATFSEEYLLLAYIPSGSYIRTRNKIDYIKGTANYMTFATKIN